MGYDNKWINLQNPCNSTKLWMLGSKMAVYSVGLISKLWLGGLNSLKLVNGEILYRALEKRPSNQGLVTVANHYSCCDEPVLWGILKFKHLVNHRLMRWSPAANDVCYTTYRNALFFSLGKSVSLHRGSGVYQKGMDFLSDRLKDGQWVHVFPEGKVNLTKEFLRLKWGVGRLVCDSNVTPIIIPMFHLGLDSVLPNKTPYIPQVRQKVTVVVGQPLEISDEIVRLKKDKRSPREIRKFVTDSIQEELDRLRLQTEQIHASWSS